MTELERVIKGLESLETRLVECGDKLDASVVQNALALLKAQEPVKPQEKREGDYKNLYCGACGRVIVGYVGNLTGKHFKVSDYCYKCGQAVKWE